METRYLARAAVLPADRLTTPFEDHHVTRAGGRGRRSCKCPRRSHLAEGLSRTAPRQPDHAHRRRGRNCTAAEYEQQLAGTGFRQLRRTSLNVPGANGLITAEKP